MKIESKRTAVELDFDISTSGLPGRVYYQNGEVLDLISQPYPCWNVLPLSEQVRGEEAYPSVIVADDPTVFSAELRQSIEDNLVRLIYVSRSTERLPLKIDNT